MKAQWMKSEVDAVDVIYDNKNDRFVFKVIIPFWLSLWILFGGDYFFIIKNAEFLKHKLKEKPE